MKVQRLRVASQSLENISQRLEKPRPYEGLITELLVDGPERSIDHVAVQARHRQIGEVQARDRLFQRRAPRAGILLVESKPD